MTCANTLAREADLVLAVGTRLQDFISGSNALFRCQVVQLNVQPMDAIKYRALPCVSDAKLGLQTLTANLEGYRSDTAWISYANEARAEWAGIQQDVISASDDTSNPSDAQVVAAVNQSITENAVVVASAGSLPAELHKHWNNDSVGGYDLDDG